MGAAFARFAETGMLFAEISMTIEFDAKRGIIMKCNNVIEKMQRVRFWAVAGIVALLTAACAGNVSRDAVTIDGKTVAPEVLAQQADKMLVVDCLLPPQIRQLGQAVTFAVARQPIKTTGLDCEIRGGEYVAYDRANLATALNAWLPLAEAGDPNAQTMVGEMFEKGLGVDPDYAAAVTWYQKAVEQKFRRAQLNLGNMYERGLGVQPDKAKALNLYRQAAGLDTQGDEIAYASTMRAESDVQKAQIAGLQQALSQKQTEVKQLRGQLSKTERDLKQRKDELQRAREELQKAQQTLSEQEQAGADKVDSDKLVMLKQQIAQQMAALKSQEVSVAALETAALAQRTQLSSAEIRVNQVAAVGPSIELIDPPVVLVRGIPEVRLRSASAARKISGRVEAPSGLASFIINGKRAQVDNKGTFAADVPVSGAKTNVELQATDAQGRKAELAFAMVMDAEASKRSEDVKPRLPTADIPFGNYYALIIGNDTYPFLPNLETAVNDAKAVDNVLRNRFGYKTALLMNATRYEILSALNQLRETLTDKDNLLIYYAGHGDLDRANNRGNWLPVDAEPSNTANWISNAAISDLLNTMPAKHVMVVADSCYSGAMTNAAVARATPDMPDNVRKKWMRIMAETRTRTVLTSGGVKPVIDNGGDGHSLFARAFLDVLQSQNAVLEGQKLYWDVAERVRSAAAQLKVEQTPQYGPIQYAGHEAGEFFLVPSGA
jgi:hypothetical protein